MKRRSPSIFLYVLLALSALSCSPGEQKFLPDDPQRWEKDIQQLEQRDALEQDPDSALLFAGSSFIRMWSNIKNDMTPYTVIQRGYGGAKLSDFVIYAKRIIYPHKFRALVLYVGNDIVGKPTDKTPAQVLDLFKQVVDIVRERYPETPIYWIQITPSRRRWIVWDKISEANRLIKEYCASGQQLNFIETADHYLGTDGLPNNDLFRADTLHLNDRGYSEWSKIIKANLQSLK